MVVEYGPSNAVWIRFITPRGNYVDNFYSIYASVTYAGEVITMKLTPLDIQQIKFPTILRGYDKNEVDHFLEVVTNAYEELLKENQSLREHGVSLEKQLGEWKRKEETISEAMLATHDIVRDLKENANRESDVIIKEAELRADTLIRDAQLQVAAMEGELVHLQKHRLVAIEKIRGVMNVFQTVLDTANEDTSSNGIGSTSNGTKNGSQDEMYNNTAMSSG